MSSYYDSELLEYVNTQAVNQFIVISTPDIYIENINKQFPFVGDRVDFRGLKHEKYYESRQDDISVDVVHFVNELIRDNICTKNERVVYIGDSLTEDGYEFYLCDLLKILPYLVNEIPQHHYLFFKDCMKLIYVSFENEIHFGML